LDTGSHALKTSGARVRRINRNFAINKKLDERLPVVLW